MYIFVRIIPIQQYEIIIKMHVNVLENILILGQVRINGHLSAQFISNAWKSLFFAISIPTTSIKQ